MNFKTPNRKIGSDPGSTWVDPGSTLGRPAVDPGSFKVSHRCQLQNENRFHNCRIERCLDATVCNLSNSIQNANTCFCNSSGSIQTVDTCFCCDKYYCFLFSVIRQERLYFRTRPATLTRGIHTHKSEHTHGKLTGKTRQYSESISTETYEFLPEHIACIHTLSNDYARGFRSWPYLQDTC